MIKKLLCLATFLAVGMCVSPNAMASENRPLVVYFSASGVTKVAAEKLSAAVGTDLLRIEPASPYTAADLDWRNDRSRSSLEMQDEGARPALARKPSISGHDVIYIGYPIWWAVAPRIVNTFLESVDLKWKTLVPFCTSGGSGLGSSDEKLAWAYPEARWMPGKEIHAGESSASLAEWARKALRQAPIN